MSLRDQISGVQLASEVLAASTEEALVHAAFTSAAEREARAAAGAQKQRDESEAAAKKREQKKAKAARQKARAAGAAQAEREQELPSSPTLGAFLEAALG